MILTGGTYPPKGIGTKLKDTNHLPNLKLILNSNIFLIENCENE